MMEKIKTIAELNDAIRILELKQKFEEKLLKDQLKLTVENLKPVNLIKTTIHDLTTSPSFKNNLLDTTISMLAGFLSKKIVVGNTHNPIKQILGTVLQMGITSIVSKNTNEIKSATSNLIKNFIIKK
jgi:hypothetical protein